MNDMDKVNERSEAEFKDALKKRSLNEISLRKMKMGKEIWSYMYRKQDLMEALGLGDDLAVTKDVALCIIASPGILLEHIIRSSMFAGLGRSTVKRAVKNLMDRGYVTSSQSEEDKRCFNLTWRYKGC